MAAEAFVLMVAVTLFFFIWSLLSRIRSWIFRKRRVFKRLSGPALASALWAWVLAGYARQRSSKPIFFGLDLPVEALKGSFLIMGGPRAGKTVLANLFRGSLLPLFEADDEEILVIDFDPKRENQFWGTHLPPTVPYFDLSPSIQGVGLDLFGECETDADIVTIADNLLPAAKNDNQPHFRNTAVLLLASVPRAARKLGHRLTLREMVLITTDLKFLRRYLSSCPLTAPVVAAHLNEGEEARSVFSTLSSGMQRYRTIAAAWSHAERLVTIDEFLSFKKCVLNMPYEDDAVPVLQPILRLILLRLEQKILKANKKNRKIIFILDEFRILRDVRFYLLACKGAEAGVSLFYSCQSFVGACEAHGEQITKELFGLAKNRIFLRLDGEDDAKYASGSMAKQHGYQVLMSRNGWGESAASKDNADSGVIMNLPLPASHDLVIRGFGTTPYTGPFNFRLSFRKHLPFLDGAATAPRLPLRPAEHLDLEPMTAAEKRKLLARP